MTGWHVAFFLALFIPLGYLLEIMTNQVQSMNDHVDMVIGIWFLLWGSYGIYLFTTNGFLRGTEGPNRYGPDPLKGAPQEEVTTKQPIQQANAHGGSQVSGKGKLQGLILVVGLIVSILAYATTPQVYNRYQVGEVPCDSPTVRDCYIPTATAAVRGGGTVLLAILAFVGISVMYKDED
jgi:hypothetical protein